LAQNAQYEKDVKEYQLRVKILEGTITTLNNRLIEMKMDSELRERDEKEKQELEQRVSLHHQELSQLQAENFELQNRCKLPLLGRAKSSSKSYQNFRKCHI